MRALRLLLSSILALAASGCATFVLGPTQSVAFSSRPQGAYCELERNGAILSQFTTPAAVQVFKGSHPLNVTCRKAGYVPIIGSVPSDMDGWIFGNAVIGGLVGMSLDLLTKADQSYPPMVTVVLHSETPASSETAARTGGAAYPSTASARVVRPPVVDASQKVGPWVLAE